VSKSWSYLYQRAFFPMFLFQLSVPITHEMRNEVVEELIAE